MAIVKNNVLTTGLSGAIAGQIIFKQYGDKTVVSKVPDMSNQKFNELQLAEQKLFRRAVAYAKEISSDPIRKAEYQSGLPAGKTVYHAALAEYIRLAKGKTRK